MTNAEFVGWRNIEFHKRLAIQMSHSTIHNLFDALVELITNSDDAYRQIESDGKTANGKIEVYVKRAKGGKCEKLWVRDFGPGMNLEELKEALKFGGETSGIYKGKSARGILGRGLKETIIALGEGEIYTIKNNQLSIGRVRVSDGAAEVNITKRPYEPNEEERREIGIIEGDGTFIRINVKNDKIKCPTYDNFKKKLSKHYALREIFSDDEKREVWFFFETKKGTTNKCRISYDFPNGKKVESREIVLPEYGDKIQIEIFESSKELDSPYQRDFADAGFLVKSKGGILANELFKFEQEKAACYFFGEIIWDGLYERIKKGEEGLIDLNRAGIDWRHQLCRLVKQEIEKIIEPFIEKKKGELAAKPKVSTSENLRKLNQKLCKMLNKELKKYFDEPPNIGIDEGEKITELTIKPPYAKQEKDKERYFSVYAPINILEIGGGPYKVKITSDNKNIRVLDPELKLAIHKEHSYIYYGKFRVIGEIDNEEATITCTLDAEHKATTIFRVGKPGKRGKRGKPRTPKGFFHEIKSNTENNPYQRVKYDDSNGIVYIYVNFPGVKTYLDEGLNFIANESKPFYAELVGKAVCSFVARKRIESGYVTLPPGGEIDAYSFAINEAEKKFLPIIHKLILESNL